MNHSPSLIYREIVEAMKTHLAPEISDDSHDMECDEMWHFLGSKKLGSGRPWIVADIDLST
jgi:hypothetical protein